MLVETMTHAEVYAELERDRRNLEKWIDRQYDECRRHALKKDAKKYPYALINNYTSPRRIRYGTIVLVYSKRKFYHLTYALHQTPTGREVCLCKCYEESDVPKIVYTPHAIKRFAERTGDTHTGEDLVRSMLLHNGRDCTTHRNQQIGARSVRYKGEMLTTLCTRDGAFLGKIEAGVVVIKTFITYEMMGGLQKEELLPHLEAFKRGHDAADELILKFNNRKTLRTNQPIKKEV